MVTAIIGRDAYRTELLVGDHSLLADEPLEAGGKNEGPAPGQFLMLSLASCTAITLRMYADRKKWSLEKIRVEVSSEKKDNTTIFTRHVYLGGNIDEAQRTRLLQIANGCPVHETLTHPIQIKTELV